ncbi:MAG: hypothetical protein KF824_12825 [Fimbriimonadaceae bacterium]|nr:MAG: hypothetical protein KF824_12825 [Fimbriimonadaceae bacterium]
MASLTLVGCGGSSGVLNEAVNTNITVIAGDYSGVLVSTNPLEGGFAVTFGAALDNFGAFSGEGEIMTDASAQVSGSLANDGVVRVFVTFSSADGSTTESKSFTGRVIQSGNEYKGSARDDNPVNPTIYHFTLKR